MIKAIKINDEMLRALKTVTGCDDTEEAILTGIYNYLYSGATSTGIYSTESVGLDDKYLLEADTP